MFYPAGTLYALAEESYRLGLYGLCNTDNMRKIYAEDYDGKGMSFMPAVDQSVFHARWRHDRAPDAPVTVFVYARPGHWRNCWEMASLALEELKRRLGDGVRIVTAGAWASGAGADNDIEQLGLLDYRATGELYRNSDVGLALTVSKHPSLPAAGAHGLRRAGGGLRQPVGALDPARTRRTACSPSAPSTAWPTSSSGCAADPELRERLAGRALQDIAERALRLGRRALAGIYDYLCDPEGKDLTCRRWRAAGGVADRHRRAARRPDGRTGHPRAGAGPRAGPRRPLRPGRSLASLPRASGRTTDVRADRGPGRGRAAALGRRGGRVVIQGDVLGRHPWLAATGPAARGRRLRPLPPRAAGAGPRPGGGAPAAPSSATASGRSTMQLGRADLVLCASPASARCGSATSPRSGG